MPRTPIATRTDAPLALADLLRIPPANPSSPTTPCRPPNPGLRQLHRTYVPFSVLVGTKYEDEAPPPAQLYTALADLGHELHFTEYLRPRMPLPDQAQPCASRKASPSCTILRVTLNGADKPLALEEFHLPGDDLELSYHL